MYICLNSYFFSEIFSLLYLGREYLKTVIYNSRNTFSTEAVSLVVMDNDQERKRTNKL